VHTPPGLDPKYTVGSLARAVTLLNILGEEAGSSGLTLTDLAGRIGMSKSSVFSMLQTLIAFDLVADTGAGALRRYRLGLGLIRLGHRAARQTTIVDVARPVLQDLSRATGLTARIGVLENDAAVALAQVDSPNSVKVNLGLGERETVHRTAIGKALVLDHETAEVVRILDASGMPAHTPNTITDPDVFLDALAAARVSGVTLDDEEDASGILCIAAPVRADDGEIIAAVSVTGIKAGPEYRDRDAVAAAVITHAQTLGRLLSVAR